ncbi:MAG: ABC transporter permease subunit [Candidatus Methanomethyliaceae archaeon]
MKFVSLAPFVRTLAAARAKAQSFLRQVLLERATAGIFLALLAIIVITGIVNPRFFSPYNLQTLGRQLVIFGFLAIGETFVIVTGGIDLSVGSLTALLNVLLALFMTRGLGTAGGLLATIAIAIAFVSAATSFLIGVSYGIISGYFGGAIDNLMMRFVDVAWGFPTLLLIILTMVFFKSSFAKVTPGTLAGTLSAIDRAMGGMFFICIGIGLTAWLMIARLARGMTLAVRERDFVEAARACGASGVRIVIKHLLPNIIGPCIVQVTLQIPTFILYEAFLSFIGLGVDPPTPSWGMMINEGYIAMRSHIHVFLAPAVALSITILAFNFIGDGLRDAFDPRWQR